MYENSDLLFLYFCGEGAENSKTHTRIEVSEYAMNTKVSVELRLPASTKEKSDSSAPLTFGLTHAEPRRVEKGVRTYIAPDYPGAAGGGGGGYIGIGFETVPPPDEKDGDEDDEIAPEREGGSHDYQVPRHSLLRVRVTVTFGPSTGEGDVCTPTVAVFSKEATGNTGSLGSSMVQTLFSARLPSPIVYAPMTGVSWVYSAEGEASHAEMAVAPAVHCSYRDGRCARDDALSGGGGVRRRLNVLRDVTYQFLPVPPPGYSIDSSPSSVVVVAAEFHRPPSLLGGRRRRSIGQAAPGFDERSAFAARLHLPGVERVILLGNSSRDVVGDPGNSPGGAVPLLRLGEQSRYYMLHLNSRVQRLMSDLGVDYLVVRGETSWGTHFSFIARHNPRHPSVLVMPARTTIGLPDRYGAAASLMSLEFFDVTANGFHVHHFFGSVPVAIGDYLVPYRPTENKPAEPSAYSDPSPSAVYLLVTERDRGTILPVSGVYHVSVKIEGYATVHDAAADLVREVVAVSKHYGHTRCHLVAHGYAAFAAFHAVHLLAPLVQQHRACFDHWRTPLIMVQAPLWGDPVEQMDLLLRVHAAGRANYGGADPRPDILYGNPFHAASVPHYVELFSREIRRYPHFVHVYGHCDDTSQFFLESAFSFTAGADGKRPRRMLSDGMYPVDFAEAEYESELPAERRSLFTVPTRMVCHYSSQLKDPNLWNAIMRSRRGDLRGLFTVHG